MSWKRHVCPLPVPGPLKTPTEHIWISDDILNGALRSFALCRTHNRHGSSTPGPLEARKRATKRRLMNIAPARGTAIEPGFLSGLKGLEQRGCQWQAPNLPASQLPLLEKKEGENRFLNSTNSSANVVLEPPLLPSWLIDYESTEGAPSLPVCHEQSIDMKSSEPMTSKWSPTQLERKSTTRRTQSRKIVPRSFLQDLIVEQKETATDRHDAFYKNLKWCRTTESIRDLATEVEVDLRANPERSKQAFRQLLELQVEPSALVDFLEDSLLNAPDARNLQYLVTWLVQNDAGRNLTRPLLKWIKRSTSLGSILEEEIVQLAKITLRFRLCNVDDSDRKTEDILRAICEGLLNSSTYRLPELKTHTVEILLQCISQRPSTVILQDLGVKLITSSHEAQLRLMHHVIPSFLQSWILYRPTSTKEEAEIFPVGRTMELSELLQWLPEDIARLSVINTSMRLLRPAHIKFGIGNGQTTLVESLRVWWTTLLNSGLVRLLGGSAEWEVVERSLASSNVGILASYLQAMNDQEKSLFILNQWFKMPRPEKYIENIERWEAFREIYRFKNCYRTLASVSPFIKMLSVLRHHHIEVSDEIMARLMSLLKALGKSDIIIEIVRYQEIIRKRMKASFIASTINDDIQASPRQANHLFESYRMLPLEKVPALAESMIADPNLHANTPLHFLRQRQIVAAKALPADARLRGQTESRFRLLERMCLAYAMAPHHPPRLALRKIHECCLAIRREQLGPISLAITQALVQAGIVRPLQDSTWVSTMKLRWILGLVKEVEGEEVADRIDEVVYEWRNKVVEEIRERQRREQRALGWNMRLQRVKEKYGRPWVEGERVLYKPVYTGRSEGMRY